jgi:hypothetical protein
MLAVITSNGSELAACVFIMNGSSAAIPTIEGAGGINYFRAWEPLNISDPQLVQCSETAETWYIEATAGEIDSLIGKRITVI